MKKQTEKNRETQTVRMMSYFIDATTEIIKKEGIDKVTIRKIADLAGYNSATIYNYFEDLSHLIFFASMRFVKKYTDALPHYLEKARTPLERYFLIWECFCKYSFESPQIYYAVFSANLGTHPINLTKYYEYFPTDLVTFPDDLKPMLLESSLSKRTLIAFNQCISEGYIQETYAEKTAEIHYLIWNGMLTMLINNRTTYTVDEATEVTVNHIRNTTAITDTHMI
ncbi:TetR family transcriptional regulator [Bacillus canaveralius]|uniref:TetR family transcriptional regulator n=1 Tax=Bacillus canaveralius TaxID=1403243 RepID=A0A2N5GJD3_9BACI|nr:TetR/AcrR family transcriptional regulator [Bacillus canaveralius]PLR81174.1 TetR family transcriptional regulator [Bacillus canaveralius]PLR95855.1 TetR family transcriptional regulator [Bacillus canaveralius]RSK50544.1 TetR family transcriptional regulator [Bacillus canaveralius]